MIILSLLSKYNTFLLTPKGQCSLQKIYPLSCPEVLTQRSHSNLASSALEIALFYGIFDNLINVNNHCVHVRSVTQPTQCSSFTCIMMWLPWVKKNVFSSALPKLISKQNKKEINWEIVELYKHLHSFPYRGSLITSDPSSPSVNLKQTYNVYGPISGKLEEPQRFTSYTTGWCLPIFKLTWTKVK